MPEAPAVRLSALLAELSALGREIEALDSRRTTLAGRRDELLLEIQRTPGAPSRRDLGALGGVSHAWIRKLITAEG
jgi:hypothetical protein